MAQPSPSADSHASPAPAFASAPRPLRRHAIRLPVLLAALLMLPSLASAAPLTRSITSLLPFANAPFPYEGIVPSTGAPFLDVVAAGRRGHVSSRAGVYWEDQTYADNRGLLFIPAGFDPERPATMVVFFHGNDATLEDDVLARQRVAAQLQQSGLNAVLAAPQFALDAFDSSAGRFWRPRVFADWLGEAGDHLAAMLGDPRLAARFDRMPVVLVAYSGGYLPAAFALAVGGANARMCGVILLDAVYGEEEAFAGWIAQRHAGFFFSAHSESTERGNLAVQRVLAERGDRPCPRPCRRPPPGGVTFLAVGGAEHRDFVTRAWRDDPLRWLLSELAANGDCRW